MRGSPLTPLSRISNTPYAFLVIVCEFLSQPSDPSRSARSPHSARAGRTEVADEGGVLNARGPLAVRDVTVREHLEPKRLVALGEALEAALGAGDGVDPLGVLGVSAP